jgi:hypothetical protein
MVQAATMGMMGFQVLLDVDSHGMRSRLSYARIFPDFADPFDSICTANSGLLSQGRSVLFYYSPNSAPSQFEWMNKTLLVVNYLKHYPNNEWLWHLSKVQ